MPAPLPNPLYTTERGQAYVGDSLNLLPCLRADSVDLVITSPPFALQRQKEYGNETEDAHVDWLLRFAEPIKRVLKPTGSFVLDLGGAYQFAGSHFGGQNLYMDALKQNIRFVERSTKEGGIVLRRQPPTTCD